MEKRKLSKELHTSHVNNRALQEQKPRQQIARVEATCAPDQKRAHPSISSAFHEDNRALLCLSRYNVPALVPVGI